MSIFVPKKVAKTQMGSLFRNPLVWLVRFRHRRGYGVHSPFAFDFITGVIYERSAYYAYSELAQLHPWWVRLFGLRPLVRCRLLFRLANYVHTKRACIVGNMPVETEYVRAALPNVTLLRSEEALEHGADFVLVDPNHSDVLPQRFAASMCAPAMLVVTDIHTSEPGRKSWQQLLAAENVVVTFDLYDFGIAFFDRRLTKQNYIVNF